MERTADFFHDIAYLRNSEKRRCAAPEINGVDVILGKLKLMLFNVKYERTDIKIPKALVSSGNGIKVAVSAFAYAKRYVKVETYIFSDGIKFNL